MVRKILLAILTLVVVSCAFLILTAQSGVSKLKIEKEYLQLRIDEIGLLVNTMEENLVSYEEYLSRLEEEVGLLRSSVRYELHDPTFLEVAEFLAMDRTDSIPYDEKNFSCLDYAVTLNNRAENLGLRCAVVTVYLSGTDHAIVAFRTTDKGLRYFEPQTDEGVNLSTGRHYWGECVLNYSSLWYYPTDSDDVVEGWELYW